MDLAIGLAKRAEGMTSPNPVVGCVIVKNGMIIGKGYHKKAGLPHAEINALKDAGEKARNATIYVTLEPCHHYGRTPPCTDAIKKYGIKKVFVGMRDPNPVNNGKGINRLKKNGISVISGVRENHVKEINRPYMKYIRTGLPFVTLKIAQSLDGKIATYKGESKWISNKESRSYVQRLRSQADAIMVGVNTVLKDDPGLIPRIAHVRKPVRVVVDTRLRIRPGSKLVRSAQKVPLLIATTKMSPVRKQALLKKKGVRLMFVRRDKGRMNIKDLLRQLGEKGIVNLLVEGGSELAGSLRDETLIDKVIVFIAPKIIGGRDAITSIGGKGIAVISDTREIMNIRIKRFGNDIMVSGSCF